MIMLNGETKTKYNKLTNSKQQKFPHLEKHFRLIGNGVNLGR